MEKSTTEMAMGLIKQICGEHIGTLSNHQKIQHAILEVEKALDSRDLEKEDENPEKEESINEE